MTVLALDLGTKMGWAIRTNTGKFSGCESFHNKKYDGAGMRYRKFKMWLTTMHQHHNLTVVYYEAVRRHIGTDAAHVYGGFMATLQAWCEENAVPYEGVPVKAIKRAVAGNGNASKVKIISAMQTHKPGVADDNEADALALLVMKTELEK